MPMHQAPMILRKGRTGKQPLMKMYREEHENMTQYETVKGRTENMTLYKTVKGRTENKIPCTKGRTGKHDPI